MIHFQGAGFEWKNYYWPKWPKTYWCINHEEFMTSLEKLRRVECLDFLQAQNNSEFSKRKEAGMGTGKEETIRCQEACLP